MNRLLRRLIAAPLVLTLALSACLFPASAAPQPAAAQPSAAPLTAEDLLHTQGQKLVNARGETVTLRGVNLGAWLIWEDWLCPYEEVAEHAEALEVLTERFGEEGAYALFNTYLDNFITAYDLD